MYDAMQPLPQSATTEVKHAQVVYLDKVKQIPREKIAEITGYARSTIRTIISRGKDMIDEIKKFFEKVVEKVRDTKKFYAYIIHLYGDIDYTKIGYTNAYQRRFKELSKKYGKVEILKIYEFDDKENAEIMESRLRQYFKKSYKNIPLDRFLIFNPTDEDYLTLDRIYQEVNI